MKIENLNSLTKKQLIEMCKIAGDNYSELFKENIKLLIFYNRVMDTLYKETRILSDIHIQYKVVENEEYVKMVNDLN